MVCECVVWKVDQKYLKGPGGMNGSAGLGGGGKTVVSSFLCCPLPHPQEPLVFMLNLCDVGLEL